MVTINVYDKGQVDDLLADKMDSVNTTGASEGDVLTLDSNLTPVWQAGGGGGSGGKTVTKVTNYSEFSAKYQTMNIGDVFVATRFGNSSVNSYMVCLTCVGIDTANPTDVFLSGTCGNSTSTVKVCFYSYVRDAREHNLVMGSNSSTSAPSIFTEAYFINFT